jgi:hypothetical protein
MKTHDCNVVAEQLEWATSREVICLACGSPMPRGSSPLFSPSTCALVMELWPDGALTTLDAVHLRCKGLVAGGIEAKWGPWDSVVIVR